MYQIKGREKILLVTRQLPRSQPEPYKQVLNRKFHAKLAIFSFIYLKLAVILWVLSLVPNERTMLDRS